MGTPLKLASLAAVAIREEEGEWIDILHPSGDLLYLGGQTKKHLRIRVVGSYSKTYRNAEKRERDAAMKRSGRMDSDEQDRRGKVILAACTLEWDGALDDDGKEIPLTKENAQALYTAAEFIADQVDRKIVDHASFFSPSSEK